MLRIGFCGKSGAGKTTAANAISTEYLHNHSAVVSFATPLKLFIQELGTSQDLQRHYAQQIGEACRGVAKDIFVMALLDRLDSHDAVVLVDDVRFPNEADALRDRDFFIIRIVRTVGEWGLEGSKAVHISETALDRYWADYTILNDGGLDKFKETVVKLAQTLYRDEKEAVW